MTQYTMQSLSQWLLFGNGYLRVRNDIAQQFCVQRYKFYRKEMSRNNQKFSSEIGCLEEYTYRVGADTRELSLPLGASFLFVFRFYFFTSRLRGYSLYSSMSPGWQASSRQMASRVEKRMALALPVFRMERFACVRPTRSDNSPSEILRLAISTSRFTIIRPIGV